MNETIIRRHNERVKPEDTVFFLGDFCFKSKSGRGEGEGYKAEHYLSQLNGKMIMIRGNHDKILGPIAEKRNIEITDQIKISA